MEYRFFLSQECDSIRDVEKLIHHSFEGIEKESFQWDFFEESAVGRVAGNWTGVVYLSFVYGARIHAFSPNRIQQALVLISPSSSGDFQRYFYRALRRLKNKDARLRLLDSTSVEKFQKRLTEIFCPSEFSGELRSLCQVSLHIRNKKERGIFLQSCLEHGVRNIVSFPVFPVRGAEKKFLEGFLEEESLVFEGEVEEKEIASFLGTLKEEGIDPCRVRLQEFRRSESFSLLPSPPGKCVNLNPSEKENPLKRINGFSISGFLKKFNPQNPNFFGKRNKQP